jgi:hypothetical protein
MTAPTGPPAIMIADDGDLADVRALLEELGAEFEDWQKAIGPGERQEPTQLLVATVSRASTLGLRRPGGRQPGGRQPGRPVWIAVLQEGATAGGGPLLESGFDFLVRRPVHPAALRHLLAQALYRGDSHRRGTRVAVGYGVTLRAGLRRHRATLVDLSPRGCRVLVSQGLSKGKAVTLQVPAELGGGEPFAIRGSVLRLQRGELEGGSASESSVSIRFEALEVETRERLRAVLRELSRGPSRMPAAAAAGSSWQAERRNRRARFEEPVLAFGDPGRVIVGSDLSRDGMRVRPGSGLRIGDTVRLAIEPGGRGEPVVVSGEVVRDDGESGLALRFGWVEPGGRERIDELVAALPAVEARGPGELAPAPATLSQLVPGLLRLGGTDGTRLDLASLVSRFRRFSRGG